jgi:guanosine-3',5'-bis(diphosphate) 3'-pyrophosphohydrolase
MPKPLLNLGDIGIMGESVRCRCGPQRMHTEAVDLGADARFQAAYLLGAQFANGYQKLTTFSEESRPSLGESDWMTLIGVLTINSKAFGGNLFMLSLGKTKEPTTLLLAALKFAAHKHSRQRRKDLEATPYINHPIEVAEVLGRIGGITDLPTLQAAILHDTIEDTETSPQELEDYFGHEVRLLVQEVTDDKSLPKQERKRLQVEHAPNLSTPAKLIKLGDKICNVSEITPTEPAEWPLRANWNIWIGPRKLYQAAEAVI